MADSAPRGETNLEIMAILDRMEALTGSATRLPLTRRAVINPKDIQELVSHIRKALPADINEALQIIRYRDTVISQAQAEASRLRADAEQEALRRVSAAQIVKDAQSKAAIIVEEGQKKGEAMLAEAEGRASTRISGADEYALEVLGRLESELGSLLATAQRGIDSLRTGHVPDDPPQRD